ncbi:Leucine-rich repeat receptor-like serine/threonine-protein kinase [Acorus calamus]|uniref:Leucine-rich repeat receptor-like serine/threonine-protein kinase n=1 Tax=Acorus calamus TaxID=4465 RepID=A0AAV9F403_ACOCL|nr:Leucine-rich repeat receptor-like serine/threonine-protein kinase [Acorus calamus]
MYGNVDSNRALFNMYRSAFGAPGLVRFPDDVFNRIWSPSIFQNSYGVINSDTSIMNVSIADRPPPSVLQNALYPLNASEPIILALNDPTFTYNLYFAEMTKLTSSKRRMIHVSTDGISTGPSSFSPPYQSVAEISITNASSLLLEAADDSTLPPIISAIEVFSVSGPLRNGTDERDVKVLKLLQDQFDALQAWAGDPCLPMYYNWEWVKCSSDQTPRITSLDLSSMDLSGVLPDFSAMDALEYINLHNNSFNGSIPDFFGNFPNLKEL